MTIFLALEQAPVFCMSFYDFYDQTTISSFANIKGYNNISRNILLPYGCNQFERQRVKLSIKIYRAEHLPFMNIGLLANMKKALTGEMTDLVDPYVQVTYGGTRVSSTILNAILTSLECFD